MRKWPFVVSTAGLIGSDPRPPLGPPAVIVTLSSAMPFPFPIQFHQFGVYSTATKKSVRGFSL
jgi:hypothetical protein